MNEKERILEMIEQGKINAKEGMELLSALDDTTQPIEIQKGTKVYKTLKVLVIAEEGDVNINVNVPLQLIKVLGSAFTGVSSLVPDDAKQEIASHGIDLSAIDINGIIRAIEDGTLESATIVDVNIKSKEDGDVVVKVYVD